MSALGFEPRTNGLKGQSPFCASPIQGPTAFASVHWTVDKERLLDAFFKVCQHFCVQRICLPMEHNRLDLLLPELYYKKPFTNFNDTGLRNKLLLRDLTERSVRRGARKRFALMEFLCKTDSISRLACLFSGCA